MVKLMLIVALINLISGFVQGLIGHLDIAILHGLIFGASLWSIRHRSSRADEENATIKRVK